MAREKKFTDAKIPAEKEHITILITTAEHMIRGKLSLPVPSVVENPTLENLLFYVINCGKMFISLRDCIITSKDNIEYNPETVKCYNINLNIVHSIQIVPEDEI